MVTPAGIGVAWVVIISDPSFPGSPKRRVISFPSLVGPAVVKPTTLLTEKEDTPDAVSEVKNVVAELAVTSGSRAT
jgi:hypothetical protein